MLCCLPTTCLPPPHLFWGIPPTRNGWSRDKDVSQKDKHPYSTPWGQDLLFSVLSNPRENRRTLLHCGLQKAEQIQSVVPASYSDAVNHHPLLCATALRDVYLRQYPNESCSQEVPHTFPHWVAKAP